MLSRILNVLDRRGRAPTPQPTSFRAGDLVSVRTDHGDFGVAKVLVADAEGIHARLYVQRFPNRPHVVNPAELSTAAFGPGHENPFSIGHIPLSHATFAQWEPVVVARGAAVAEDELDGYEMWLDAEAGYF